MSTCASCRQNNPLSRWDKFKSNVMWKLFGQEVRDEQTSHATQEFARGYTHGRGVESEIQSKVIDALKEEIERLRVFKTVDVLRLAVQPGEVISMQKDGIYLGENKMNTNEAHRLKDEAKQLKTFRIWDVLQNTMKQKAIEKGHYLSQNWDDVQLSRAMTLTCISMKGIVDMCEALQIKEE